MVDIKLLIFLGVAFGLWVAVFNFTSNLLYSTLAGFAPMIAYLAVFLKAYPVRVTIFETRKDGTKICYDKARRVKDKNGEYYYELKSRKLKTKPQDLKNIFIDEKGKDHLVLYSENPKEISSMYINKPEHLHPLDEDLDFWRATEMEKAFLRWQKKGSLDKWLPIIAIFIILIGSGIFFYIIGGQMTNIAAQQVSMQGELSMTTKEIRNLYIAVRGGTPVVEPLSSNSATILTPINP